jgi:hypothetical protein
MKISTRLNIFLFLFFGTVVISCNQREQIHTTKDFNKLSESLIQKLIDGKNTQNIQRDLANTSLESLQQALNTDAKKMAFWINVYNAYIQIFLAKNPGLYDNRSSFFGDNQIKIAGEMISFSKIEHGIIRKSQWELGLGYVRTWFPNKFERVLRVSERDYRVHFALNCGAKDCPPIAVYTPMRLQEQLNLGTKRHLEKTSFFDAKKKVVTVTSLFSWFRGDFGGKSGIKDILQQNNIIPSTKGISINYSNYNWNLDLNNFIEL